VLAIWTKRPSVTHLPLHSAATDATAADASAAGGVLIPFSIRQRRTI